MIFASYHQVEEWHLVMEQFTFGIAKQGSKYWYLLSPKQNLAILQTIHPLHQRLAVSRLTC